jgi:hypothetical protein
MCWTVIVPAPIRANLVARKIDCDDVLRPLDVPLLVTQGLADQVVLPAMAEHVLAERAALPFEVRNASTSQTLAGLGARLSRSCGRVCQASCSGPRTALGSAREVVGEAQGRGR